MVPEKRITQEQFYPLDEEEKPFNIIGDQISLKVGCMKEEFLRNGF